MRTVNYLAVWIIASATFVSCSQIHKSNPDISHITAAEVKTIFESDTKPVLLDVRTAEEYTGSLGKIDGSILIPLQELDERAEELNQYKDQRIK